jgi:hypothetical protein
MLATQKPAIEGLHKVREFLAAHPPSETPVSRGTEVPRRRSRAWSAAAL